ILMETRIPVVRVLPDHVNNGQTEENHCDRSDTQSHSDAETMQTSIARGGIVAPAAISIVTAPVAAAMRNLSRTAAAQLRLAFLFDVIAYDRHNILKMIRAPSQVVGASCLTKSGSWPEALYS